MTSEERNYEFRTIPEVSPSISVSRDGEIKYNGQPLQGIHYLKFFRGGYIIALDGTKMSIQMFIHKAFPDIPLRHTPTH